MPTMLTARSLRVESRRGLLDLLHSAMSARREELRIRRSILELSAMSEHMLRDLGLAQGDIERAARHGLA
jgi:uncharacterized protein YjiS (DUF1127 family)